MTEANFPSIQLIFSYHALTFCWALYPSSCFLSSRLPSVWACEYTFQRNTHSVRAHTHTQYDYYDYLKRLNFMSSMNHDKSQYCEHRIFLLCGHFITMIPSEKQMCFLCVSVCLRCIVRIRNDVLFASRIKVGGFIG